MYSRTLSSLLSVTIFATAPTLAIGQQEPETAVAQSQTGDAQSADYRVDAKATKSPARLVGLPVLGLHKQPLGTVDNVVLGRPDGDFVIIKIDRGMVPGTRLVGVYKQIMDEIETEDGPALWLSQYRIDDLRDFEDFSYTDDMQLAVPRSATGNN